MFKSKQALTMASVLCIVALCLTVLYVQAGWTTADMVSWMENVGKPKIWKILKNTNDMKKAIVDEVAHESVEVEIQTFKHDTQVDYVGSISMYSTEIGGGDRHSCVYMALSFRGQKIGASSVTTTVKDGGKYSWTRTSTWLTNGLYRIYVHAPSGMSAGSYLVMVEVTKTIGADTYYGTGSYIIECTATTT